MGKKCEFYIALPYPELRLDGDTISYLQHVDLHEGPFLSMTGGSDLIERQPA